MKSRSRVFGSIAAAVLAATIVVPVAAAPEPGGNPDFVNRAGPNLTLDGKPFRFVGTNNYYLMYSSPFMVNDVLDTAAANGFTVIRTWGWLDQTPKNGIVFQTFDGTSISYNDGASGLANLDYVVAQAGTLHLKLVIPFTGNWGDFGGMDQYVTWAGGSHHDDFYTNPTIKTWYKAWISHLLNHVNSITGVAYKDDPTIMTWELANEPRCVGSGTYPRSASCTTSTITNWASEMSAYIQSLDHKHLVSSGSEGELCIAGSTDWTRNCGEGVDELAIAKLPTIDVMSYHLYPDGGWSKDLPWATTWIKDHVKLAKQIGKPSMLGEFGLKDKVARNVTYKSWTDTVRTAGGNGALSWILTEHQDDSSLYPDFDGFRITCPSPVCTTLANAAIGLTDQHSFDRLAPVADNLSASVEFAQTASFAPAASSVAYGPHNAPEAGSIDLDPATAGQQTSITVTGGTFALQPDGTVLFTPASGFHGPSSATFTIGDKYHRTSNVAILSVFVKPLPATPIKLFSFETGTEGWSGPSAQSSAWASDGTSSLLDSKVGDWITGAFSPPLDLSNGYTAITIDAMNSVDSFGFIKISIQTGSGYTWCENGGQSLPPSSSGSITATFDITSTSCDLSDIKQMNVYVSTPTYIDNITAK